MKLQAIRDWVYALPISKPLQEVLLRALRIAFIAAVSAVLAYFVTLIELLPPAWQGIATIIFTLIGDEWDKYKYVLNSENRVKGVNNYGLVGF